MDYIPAGFWKINAFTNGYQIVVLGSPPNHHNCDQMGCGSVGDHVLCRIPIMYPVPELRWAKQAADPGEQKSTSATPMVEQNQIG